MEKAKPFLIGIATVLVALVVYSYIQPMLAKYGIK